MEKEFVTYGIGNALVDLEFEVTEEQLKSLNVEKGIMTLVDEETVDRITKSSFLTSKHMSCGGSAGNTMIALAQLGQSAFYSCKVSNDKNGRFFLNEVEKSGLQTNLSKQLAEVGKTGQCMVFVTPDAERTMNTYLGITETFSVNEINFEALKNSKILYVEGYLVTSETGRAAAKKAIEFAKEHHVLTAFTFSDPSMPTYFKDGLIDLLGSHKLDILFCNRDELTTFTGEKNIQVALDQGLKLADQVVMTNGAEGAIYHSKTKTVSVPAPKITPVDTIGAGDLFAGAFLYSFFEKHDIEKCLMFSCACASKVVTQYGSRLTIDEINKLKMDILLK